jgi:hypothetical protein
MWRSPHAGGLLHDLRARPAGATRPIAESLAASSGRRQDFLQHILALDEPLPRHVGPPAARDFSQVSNRNIDGRTQVDGEVGFTRDLMVAQPDNLGTQRGTPESPHKNAGARLINR